MSPIQKAACHSGEFFVFLQPYSHAYDSSVSLPHSDPQGPGGLAIVLESTVFHPQGGGQPSDQGVISCMQNGVRRFGFDSSAVRLRVRIGVSVRVLAVVVMSVIVLLLVIIECYCQCKSESSCLCSLTRLCRHF